MTVGVCKGTFPGKRRVAPISVMCAGSPVIRDRRIADRVVLPRPFSA